MNNHSSITRTIALKQWILTIAFALFLIQQATAQCTTDSAFLSNSTEVIFRVNRTEITPEYRNIIINQLVPRLRVLSPGAIVIGRTAASPEGPYDNNRRLANGRRDALKQILESEGINASRIHFDLAIEEYALLVEMMRLNRDVDYELVREIVESCHGDDILTKKKLKAVRRGELFARLLKEYFPELRAVRIAIYDAENGGFIKDGATTPMIFPDLGPIFGDTVSPMHIDPLPIIFQPEETGMIDFVDEVVHQRRELLSIKTNLAMYAAYVPKYGWCPLPNVSVEYYPKRGHFTIQGDFDCPWWIGNTTNHKYFELRNYTVEGRYYLRSSKKSYTDGLPNGKAAFQGFYLSAYAHAFLYQIGLNKDDGWVGEGLGAGVGLGYVIPLGRRNQHWRLEIGAQVGFFRTKYDPFVYGCPVEKIENGKYYYDYTGDADLFQKRQYRFNWLGPTRAGITLSYDLLYRKNGKKGVSFRHTEKGGKR